MFNLLIAFIGFLLQRECDLEGYRALAMAWSGQKGRVDKKGHIRQSDRLSPLAYMLRKPELRAELQLLFQKVHGISANFQATVDGFYTPQKGLSGKALAMAKSRQNAAIAQFETALQQLPVPATAGWNFMVGSKSDRLLAVLPGGTDDFETDEFLTGASELLQTAAPTQEHPAGV